MIDYVYQKPSTVIHILLRIRQPKLRQNQDGKPLNFLETPYDYAMFHVVQDCFDNTMKKQVGYEASLANISYEL